jgi:hypothetical protein
MESGTFHRLLKRSGPNAEEWEPESGAAFLRRLGVAVMVCWTVGQLIREPSEKAARPRHILARLLGRQMKRGVESTVPALWAGLEKLLALDHLRETEDGEERRDLARRVLSKLFRSG